MSEFIQIQKAITIFDINFYFNKIENINKEYTHFTFVSKHLQKNFIQDKEVKQWIRYMFNITEYNDNPEIIINLESDDKSINLNNFWETFILNLNKNNNLIIDNNNNINIYDIIINRTKHIIKEEKPKQIIKEENKEIIIEKQDEEFEIKTNIEFKLINNIYKDFTTLYLKKYDLDILSTTLNNFKNKQNIYRELGLPYKFGALLYGEGGVGKSSSIMAIASYLQKDIYYLDFNNISTNKDLKNVFNKINKEITNNGIIVMEDIDVMTNIVHKRELHNKNEDLTLECFLNLLQGTLTQDGSIFIATTNNIDILDDAFIRDGRFDIKIHLESCDHYQMNLIYNKFFNRNIPNELINQIPEKKITPATFISKILPYLLTNTDDEIIIQNIIR